MLKRLFVAMRSNLQATADDAVSNLWTDAGANSRWRRGKNGPQLTSVPP
jgi:hypothetical protein